MYPDKILISTVLFLSATTVFALDRTQPINLEADQVELDDKAGTSTYIGNVTLTQGPLTLNADKVVVTTKDRKLSQVSASGKPVKLKDTLENKDQLEAEALQMDYDVASSEIVLTGQGMLNQNGNVLHNDQIRYNLSNGTLKAGGTEAKERVKVILQPEQPATP